jgi:hypothetical protein
MVIIPPVKMIVEKCDSLTGKQENGYPDDKSDSYMLPYLAYAWLQLPEHKTFESSGATCHVRLNGRSPDSSPSESSQGNTPLPLR